MAISKPILEQTLDEYRKQMSVNGETSSLSHHHEVANTSSRRRRLLRQICRRGLSQARIWQLDCDIQHERSHRQCAG